MKYTIHDYDKRLEMAINKLKASPISDNNKKVILDFKNECLVNGLTKGRALKYIYYLLMIAKWLGKDFQEANKDDIKIVVGKIEESKYAPISKKELKMTIRKVYKWLEGSEEYPEKVKWISLYIKNQARIKIPEELVSEEEIQRMIQASSNPRDRAFIASIYESGCRIGEILFLKIKHVSSDQYGVVIVIDGKTGQRRIRLISSAPYLIEWINKHPNNSPDSFVWISQNNEILEYNGIRTLIRRIGRKAGVNKRLNPHIFRHSRATFLANHLTEAQMKEYFGWVRASDMAAVYVHLSGRDVDNALLRLNGIEVDKENNGKSKLIPKKCNRCEDENPVTSKFCKRCGFPLNSEMIMDMVKTELERKDADNMLDKLIEDREFRELFERKIKEMKHIQFTSK